MLKVKDFFCSSRKGAIQGNRLVIGIMECCHNLITFSDFLTEHAQFWGDLKEIRRAVGTSKTCWARLLAFDGNCPDGKVRQANIGCMIQQHVAMDSAKAPEVLIFQIGTIAVFIHLDSYLVLSFADIGSDIKLARLH